MDHTQQVKLLIELMDRQTQQNTLHVGMLKEIIDRQHAFQAQQTHVITVLTLGSMTKASSTPQQTALSVLQAQISGAAAQLALPAGAENEPPAPQESTAHENVSISGTSAQLALPAGAGNEPPAPQKSMAHENVSISGAAAQPALPAGAGNKPPAPQEPVDNPHNAAVEMPQEPVPNSPLVAVPQTTPKIPAPIRNSVMPPRSQNTSRPVMKRRNSSSISSEFSDDDVYRTQTPTRQPLLKPTVSAVSACSIEIEPLRRSERSRNMCPKCKKSCKTPRTLANHKKTCSRQ